jgi:type VI secretion system secreted protein VgrG
VGPRGEEIHTDEYGRIRLQFHWDRLGKFDENSTPWVRVATQWAGSGFGQVSIPRIGQEVVVLFIDGNPDLPLVIGSLYNGANMPPWPLPANRTQSGVLTRSSLGGKADHANALRFEDRKGSEEVWLHAEKNQRIEVEHDESHTVGHDQVVGIGHDRTETVGNNETITVHGSRKETVDHNEQIHVGDNRTESVGKDQSVTIYGHASEHVHKTKKETINYGKSLFVGAAYQTTVIGAMNTSVGMAQMEQVGLSKTVIVGQESALTAGTEHRITVGNSVIVMTPGRIEISADEIRITGYKKVEVHGDDVDHNPG